MPEEREARELHLLGLDLLAQELGRAADHHAGHEHRDDHEDQHVDEADAHAAEDVVEPHADQRHQASERRERVVHRVDRPIRRHRRRDRPERREAGAEADLLAFHRAGRLVHAHGRDGGIASGFLGDAEHDHRQVDGEHGREDHDRQPPARQHVTQHDHHGHRDDGDRPGLDEVRERRRVLVRVRRVRAEIAAAVRAQLLDGHDPRGDAPGDGLLLPLDGRGLGGALERHRRALPHHQHRHQQRQRQEHANDRTREVHVEVAEHGQAVASQAADDCHGRGDAGAGRHELQEGDDEHLREVREARLAAVVLQVRVGHEARDRVEGERRLHVGDRIRIDRQAALQHHDGEGRQPHDNVRDEQRHGIALPVLLLVGIDAGRAQHEPLDGRQDRVEKRAPSREDLRHVRAQQPAGRNGEQNRDNDGDVFRSHVFLRTVQGAASRRRGTRKQRQSAAATTASWFHLHPVAEGDEGEHGGKRHQPEQNHSNGQHDAVPFPGV